MVVDDDDIRFSRAPPDVGDKAIVIVRALGAEAGLCVCCNLLPERNVLGKIVKLRPVAGFGRLHPGVDDRQENGTFELLGSFESYGWFHFEHPERSDRLQRFRSLLIRLPSVTT
jgi:hypothetical protein